jgi:hypothetical protein
MELSTTQKGAVAECEIASAAVRLGIVVLRPLVEGRRYDLIFDTGPELLRVQCKWGRVDGNVIMARLATSRHTPAGYIRTTYTSAEIDGFAVYCDATRDVYWLPIERFASMTYVHLRLLPARNNQRLGLHFAADYRLGAIAQLGERSAGSRKVEGSSPSSSTTHVTPLS